jgi:hypothetical protein
MTLAALGIAVVLGTATACANEESGTPQRAETSQATSAPNGAPTVEVLDPGAEPREALRFSVTEGTQPRATMTTKMEIGVEIGGEPMEAPPPPPVLTDMTAIVNHVDPSGDIHVTTTVENFRVGDGSALPPEAKRSLDQLSGLTVQAVMSANGEQRDADLDIPTDLDPQMRSLLEGMSSQLAKLAMPFPTEPVGNGARWRTHTSAELNGVRTEMSTTYTLRERTGDRYRADVSYDQSAPEQDAAIPGMPPGVRAHVTGMAISGSGEIDGSLAMVLPLSSTMQASGTIDWIIDDGSNSEEMDQKLDMTMSLESVQ